MDASPACFVCFDERLDNICGNCSDSDTGRKAEVRKLSSLPERRLPNIWGRRSMRANPPRRWSRAGSSVCSPAYRAAAEGVGGQNFFHPLHRPIARQTPPARSRRIITRNFHLA